MVARSAIPSSAGFAFDSGEQKEEGGGDEDMHEKDGGTFQKVDETRNEALQSKRSHSKK